MSKTNDELDEIKKRLLVGINPNAKEFYRGYTLALNELGDEVQALIAKKEQEVLDKAIQVVLRSNNIDVFDNLKKFKLEIQSNQQSKEAQDDSRR